MFRVVGIYMVIFFVSRAVSDTHISGCFAGVLGTLVNLFLDIKKATKDIDNDENQ